MREILRIAGTEKKEQNKIRKQRHGHGMYHNTETYINIKCSIVFYCLLIVGYSKRQSNYIGNDAKQKRHRQRERKRVRERAMHCN